MTDEHEHETATPPRPMRLADDDLYAWAQLIADIESAQKALDRFGRSALTRLGLDPTQVTLNNEGYILPVRTGVLSRQLAEAGRNGTD